MTTNGSTHLANTSFPVYLDYNATTPLDEQVIQEISRSLSEDWGNPSSSHVFGERAKRVIEQSRIAVARMLHAELADIIFTSGGTEVIISHLKIKLSNKTIILVKIKLKFCDKLLHFSRQITLLSCQ